MTEEELRAMVAGIADAMKEHVAQALRMQVSAIVQKLDAMERKLAEVHGADEKLLRALDELESAAAKLHAKQ